MAAIIEKELRSYFCTVRGYVFVGVFLLISGYFFITYNVINGNAESSVMLENTVVSFVLLIPVLTMGLFAGEKKAGTSSLYLCSPLSKWEIVMGKYIAAVIVFLCAVAINSISAIIMIFFKGQTLGEVFAVYTGFALLGMAFIAVGMFISVLTESQIVAAIISLCVCFSLYISDWLLDITSNPWVRLMSLPNYYSKFLVGIFDVRAMIYFLSFSAMFVLFTVIYLERVEVKAGKKTDSVIIILSIIASFVLVSVAADKLSKRVQMTFDMSHNNIFELTAETEKYLETMQEDVTIYYLATESGANPYIEEVLQRYDRASSRVRLKNVDIIKNPAFTSQYVKDNETLSKGSIIIESSKRFTVIEPDAAFAVKKDSNGNLSRGLGFGLEEKLTRGLDYVLNDKISTAVWLTGHGEKGYEKPAGVLKNENVQTEYSDNISTAAENADLILVCSPSVDITENEAKVLREYLSRGGSLFLALDPGFDLPNLKSVASEYGMTAENLVLTVDNVSELIRNNRLYLITIPTKHKITEGIVGTRSLLFPVTSLITVTEKNGLDITNLAVTDKATSSRTFNKDTLGEKTDTGVFTVCAVSENRENGSKLLLAGSSQFLNPSNDELGDVLEASNYSNREFFVKSVKYLLNYKDTLLIGPKDIMSRSLNLSQGTQVTLILIFGALLPIAVFARAFAVFRRRRHL